jgi:hypothetical protein
MDDQVLVSACSNGNEYALASGVIDGFRKCDELKCRYVFMHEKKKKESLQLL